MKRSLRLATPLAVPLMLLITCSAQGAAQRRPITHWDNLAKLTSGTEIKVVLTNGKSYQGKFQGFAQEAIVVESGHGQQTLSRRNVLRVSVKGKSHRLRNTLIGTAIGAGVGLALGTYVDANPRAVFNLAIAAPNAGKEIFGPSFAVVGAVVGAALPARRWRDIYRSR